MPTSRLSLQLYSVRDALHADEDGTLARLAEIGLRNVEVFDFVHRPRELADALARHGLAARTGHAAIASPGQTPDTLRRTFDAAQVLGLETVFEPMVPAARWAEALEIDRTASLLNEAAAVAAGHGLRIGYHNHAQEFTPTIDGMNAYDRFVERLDAEVGLEVDVYWASAGGKDAVGLLRRLGPRVRALHIKDGAVIDDPHTSGAPFDVALTRQVPAGQGEIPLAAALAAAPDTAWAVVEFDHYAGDMFEGVAGSVAYLNEKGIV
ncbi:sugar phosphate isomerase/epimerase [Streptomyces sp. NBC_00893]|uniref:sugar phosphate isomerase/epimerase family protein n=1 Tax=Streptomyces sp. NBC_00893 TaxID=2975862 RepID=UPI002259D793|nr:sugar phosphate isomerase/epimerase [Streptomyces sp. NBC_00893]MCX4850303.1 sugar phosphate isomerase/epimerase [Streptomyces sp. NBC_00893]